jgi:hypothetical protein
MAIAASYRARATSAGKNLNRVSERHSETTAAITRMRQLNQNGGIASLPEIDVYSTALSVPDGLDKEDTLGHVDDQEGESVIGSACVEICGGEVGGEESSAHSSPEIRVQGLVEDLNAEEANLEITDADITESVLAAFSGYPVALRVHLDELQVIASCSEESPSDEQC